MNWNLRLLLAMMAIGAAAPLHVHAADDDHKTIQGPWIVVSSERDGVVTPSDKIKARDVQLIFEDEQLIAKTGDKSVSLGTYSLDASKTPKTYDRTYPDGSVRHGIYKFEDKKLTICVADLGKERPKDFGTKKGDSLTQVVYQRE